MSETEAIEPELVTIEGFGGKKIRLTPATAYWFAKLVGAGQKASPPVEFPALSGFRTPEQQQAQYQRAVAKYGQGNARRYVALPGNSKHNAGTGIDLYLGYRIRSENADAIRQTATWKWLARNLGTFGFRFYNQKIEPWHIELKENFSKPEGKPMADIPPADLNSDDAKNAMAFLQKQGFTADEITQIFDKHVNAEDNTKKVLLGLGYSQTDVARLLSGPQKAQLTAESVYRQFATLTPDQQTQLLTLLGQAGAGTAKLDSSLLGGMKPQHLIPSPSEPKATSAAFVAGSIANLPPAQQDRLLSILAQQGNKFPNPDITKAGMQKKPAQGSSSSDQTAKTIQTTVTSVGGVIQGLLKQLGNSGQSGKSNGSSGKSGSKGKKQSSPSDDQDQDNDKSSDTGNPKSKKDDSSEDLDQEVEDNVSKGSGSTSNKNGSPKSGQKDSGSSDQSDEEGDDQDTGDDGDSEIAPMPDAPDQPD